jgi:hypothetical protein
MADMRKVLAIFVGLAAITALWFFGLVVSGGFGLPWSVPRQQSYERAEAIKRRDAGETLADIAKSYAVHLSMISRL